MFSFLRNTRNATLLYLLTEKAGSSNMIFTRTYDITNTLSLMLRNLGFRAIPINGHMSQSETRSIEQIYSRGMSIMDYIHRIARAGRGSSGAARTCHRRQEANSNENEQVWD